MIKYALASLSEGCVNYGNRIIEKCVLDIFKDLGKPHCTFSSFRGEIPKEINECEFVLSPGATSLFRGDSANLEKVNRPIVIVGGCIGRGRLRGYQDTASKQIDPTIAEKCLQPIAVRDSYTEERLKELGFSTVRVGCPTLFAVPTILDKNYIAVSFGRKHIERFSSEVRRAYEESGLPIYPVIHEKTEIPYIGKYLLSHHKACDTGNADDMLSIYMNATFIMTGRIHGAIPAVAGGKKVAYYSSIPEDSRETLLDDIGLQRYSIDEYSYDKKCMGDYGKVVKLKRNMLSWRDNLLERFGIEVSIL
jgi:hypothetical protein